MDAVYNEEEGKWKFASIAPHPVPAEQDSIEMKQMNAYYLATVAKNNHNTINDEIMAFRPSREPCNCKVNNYEMNGPAME